MISFIISAGPRQPLSLINWPWTHSPQISPCVFHICQSKAAIKESMSNSHWMWKLWLLTLDRKATERERESWFWKYDCRSTTESLHDDDDDEPEIVLEILCWCVHLSADHGRPLSLIAGAQPGPNSQVIALQLALPPPLWNTSSTKQEKNTPGSGARLDHASP